MKMTSKMMKDPKNEDDFKNENKLKNEDNLKKRYNINSIRKQAGLSWGSVQAETVRLQS